MDIETNTETQAIQRLEVEHKKPIRKRAGKRTNFRVPKTMPVPVRALWEQATEDEKKLAHRTCSVMLEYWLGRATKKEAAERLGLPGLRVWQLSQQALSGMLAGLLVQPRTRGRLTMARNRTQEDDPKMLKKKIQKLEQKIEIQQQLIDILGELPGNRERKLPATKPRKNPGKKIAEAVHRGDPSDGGSMASGEGPHEG